MFEHINNQVSAMWFGFVESIPAIVIAIMLLLVAGLVATYAVKIADKLIGKTDLRPSLRNLIETTVKLGIWLLGITLAAIIVFPDLTPGSLFAGLGIGAVAIGFAFQDIFENFFAGVLIMLREKMRIGDVIQCQGISGAVEHISLRETHIRAGSGELTIVPNSILFKNPVEIFTDGDQRGHSAVVSVNFDTDLDKAAEVIRKAVETVDAVDLAKGIDVFASEFRPGGVEFLVRWWAGSSPLDQLQSRDKILRAIKQALATAGIEGPRPVLAQAV
ncbi:MAG: mechanosensitive ion channel family protein [Erythrobacter sp.]